jgi:alkanesulfonate monooxygenase SsuD/methylene tetrahydromethanopterin reductase-like flavin-dependent oxidoreductase (luciferase family)
MRFGLALPQYDYSVAHLQRPLQFDTIVEHARAATAAGATSVWLSDHLFLDIGKYGGPPDRQACFDPLVTFGALARLVPDVRLGSLVFCEALRPASVLAKALATLDRISAGRIDVGVGAGWYEPEYEAIGMHMPPPRERLDRLTEALAVLKGLLPGGPFTFEGIHHRAVDGWNAPAATQAPRPRVFVGGKGDRLLRIVANHADGWNTCWTWTCDDYRERLRVLEAECARVQRDPASVWRTLGLYALCGEDERDLVRRFARLQAVSQGVLDGVDLAAFRHGRLVGTVDEVRAQIKDWNTLGIDTMVLGVGAVPFQVSAVDDVELLLYACTTA